MDIMVQGEGSKFYKPNQVDISINFYANDKTYEKVLQKGTTSVEDFIENVLNYLEIDKKDLKTRNFRVSKNIRYDYQTKKQIDNGFDYNQNASLKLDYDMEKISEFMEKVSELENAPRYDMTFNIKEEDEAKKEVLKEAYCKAKEKAEIIAMSAGKKLVDCVKVDFKPFEEKVYSDTRLSDKDFMCETIRSKEATSDVIQNIFTPEDVVVWETLYCLWIAE